jgi:hypothetical protein
MNANEFKPLTVEDFGLKPEEIQELVEGAQTFIGPPVDSDEN